MSVPSHPDRFTTDWLEQVLGAPRGALKGFSAKPVGTGQMSLSFRVALDWQNHEDFNHPLIIIVTLITLLSVIAGIVLIPYRIRFGRVRTKS